MPGDVVVVGSLNLDLSVSVDRLPKPSETVFGTDLLRAGGGKGANQAVAAARLGKSVSMIGCVGDDDEGRFLLDGLRAEGIDCSSVIVAESAPTGMAFIEVDSDGENRIVVVPGANLALVPEHVAAEAETIAAASVVLVQYEISPQTIEALVAIDRSGTLVVNPAPAVPGIRLTGNDVLVPNRSELALLAGGDIAQSESDLVDQATSLSDSANTVIVTLGGDGVLMVDDIQTGHPTVTSVEAAAVVAIDTTAAGDAFCGALASALSSGVTMVDAVRWASRSAALAVTQRGAQPSLPTTGEVEASFGSSPFG